VVESSVRCRGACGGLRTEPPEEELFINEALESSPPAPGLDNCGNLSVELFRRSSLAACRAPPPAPFGVPTDGSRPQLALRALPLEPGAPDPSEMCWTAAGCREEAGDGEGVRRAGLGVGESGESHSEGRSVRCCEFGAGEWPRFGVPCRLEGGESGPLACLVDGLGEGGGFGLFLTLAQMAMWRSAAFLAKFLEQCGQVVMLLAGRGGELDSSTGSPRPALQIDWNSAWARRQAGSLFFCVSWAAFITVACFCWYAFWLTKQAPPP